MKCCICGAPIEQFGNNPFPLCDKNDYESRCCDRCNDMVIKARIASLNKDNREPTIGDTIVIFYSSQSKDPYTVMTDTGKFLSGIVENVIQENNQTKYQGTWGSFLVIKDTDQYRII